MWSRRLAVNSQLAPACAIRMPASRMTRPFKTLALWRSASMRERSPAPGVERLRSLTTDGPPSREVEQALAEALFRSALRLREDPAAALKQLNEAISLDPFRPAFR